jgi:hypothetical protein
MNFGVVCGEKTSRAQIAAASQTAFLPGIRDTREKDFVSQTGLLQR